MAAPTSTNEVTARKLSSSISALWTKIKSTFQPVADRVTSIRAASSATDTNYPTEKAVRTELDKMAPGAITTEATIANGDKLLFSDVSDSGKIKRMSGVTFDAATKNRFLSRNGTFERVLEADVDWGGAAISGNKAPIETFTRQNAWFGPKPSAVYAEYTTNLTADNPTWTDYGLTDVQKQKLFSGTDLSVAVTAGKATHVHPGFTGTTTAAKDLTPEMEPDQGMRVTICCRSLSTRDVDTDYWCYSYLRRILIYVATSSSRGMKVKVERQTGTRYKSNDGVWEDLGTFAVSGDSGWNSIPVANNFGGGWTQNSNIYTMRFTFWAESMLPTPAASQTGCCRVMGIVALNHIMWNASGLSPEMQRSGLPCAIAYDGSVTFPANVKAPTFEGKLKTARKLAVSLSNTSTDTSFDGSADVTNIKTAGTLGVGNGGTGRTSVTSGNYVVGAGTSAMVEMTPKDVGSNVLSSLDDKSNASSYADFVDNDFVVGSDHVDASTISASTFVRRTALNLWNYMKGKISSVLGLTASAYGGTAAVAKAYDPNFTGTNSIAKDKQNLIAWDANADTYNASTNRAATVDSIVKRIAVKPDGFSASVDYTNAVELSIPYSAGPGRVALMCVATTGNGDTASFQATFVKNANEKLKFVVGTIMASTGTFVSPVLKFLSSDDSSPAQKVVLYIDANVRCNLSCLVAANDGMSSITVTEVARSTADNYSSLHSWGRLANDSGVVHIDGTETIIGAKEFSRSGQDTNFTDSSGAESIVRARTSSNSNNGSAQIDAYAGGGKFGVYARNASGTGKWVACLDNDGVVNLGSSGDAVRIGGTKFVFGASQLGTDSNTFYWV